MFTRQNSIATSVEDHRDNMSLPGKKSENRNGIITGCCFITATVTAIMGLKLYDPILASGDYLQQGAAHAAGITVGAICELLVIAANCGTAIMLFPYLKRYNERLAVGYYTFRLLESVSIFVGVVSVLALLALSQSYNISANPDEKMYHIVGTIGKAFHDWTFLLGPKFFLGINTFIDSYVFFKTKLVPVKLSMLGMAGAILVFINSMVTMFGAITPFSLVDMITVFPIASYEMLLAAWLISKGFNSHAYARLKQMS